MVRGEIRKGMVTRKHRMGGIAQEDKFAFMPGSDGCAEEQRPLLDIFGFPRVAEDQS
jgi:hypothetical protein